MQNRGQKDFERSLLDMNFLKVAALAINGIESI